MNETPIDPTLSKALPKAYLAVFAPDPIVGFVSPPEESWKARPAEASSGAAPVPASEQLLPEIENVIRAYMAVGAERASTVINLMRVYQTHLTALQMAPADIETYLRTEGQVLRDLYAAVRDSRPSPSVVRRHVYRLALDARTAISEPLDWFEFRRANGGWEVGYFPTYWHPRLLGPAGGYRKITAPFAWEFLEAVADRRIDAEAIVEFIEQRFNGPPREDDRLEAPPNEPAVTVTVGKPASPYDPLRGLIETLRLRGNEKTIVLAICDSHGAIPLADLAVRCEWQNQDDNWNSARKRLNQKFKSEKWRFERHDNKAIATELSTNGGRK